MEFLRNSFVLTGPTASGKTSLGIGLAQKLNAEIICMDSMTLYQGMDIGTAKPSFAVQSLVNHHLLNAKNPSQSCNVAWWLSKAETTANEILARGKTPLFIGGTPLYLKALLFGLFHQPEIPKEKIRFLEEEFGKLSSLELHNKLKSVDPKSANRIHENDKRRILRALIFQKATGTPLSVLQNEWKVGNPRPELMKLGKCVWLEIPRQVLYKRIHERTAYALQHGWVEEAENLLRQFPNMSREARQAIGYMEIFDYLVNGGCLKEVEEKINLRTRHYAKHQETWFKNLPRCLPASELQTRNLWQEYFDQNT